MFSTFPFKYVTNNNDMQNFCFLISSPYFGTRMKGPPSSVQLVQIPAWNAIFREIICCGPQKKFSKKLGAHLVEC
jgi:hypothetical protein